MIVYYSTIGVTTELSTIITDIFIPVQVEFFFLSVY